MNYIDGNCKNNFNEWHTDQMADYNYYDQSTAFNNRMICIYELDSSKFYRFTEK